MKNLLVILFILFFSYTSGQQAAGSWGDAPVPDQVSRNQSNYFNYQEIKREYESFNTGIPKFDKDDGSKKMFLPPSIKIIKAGYLKKEKFKGVIFTDISHHSIFPNKVRKQIVSLFKKSDYVTNKKKWNTKKNGFPEENIYVTINSKYFDNSTAKWAINNAVVLDNSTKYTEYLSTYKAYSDFSCEWEFKDYNQEVILSFKTINKDFPEILKELKLIE